MAFDPGQPHPETLADFALMEARPGAMFRYWRLAVETANHVEHLREKGVLPPGGGWIEAHRASSIEFIFKPVKEDPESKALIGRWIAWDDEYLEIYENSPKWRLKGMISSLSETHTRLSWPQGWERDVWQWAISKLPEDGGPFDDRDGIIDAQYHMRMRDLIMQCGGFLYLSEETGQVVFARTKDLPRIWKHQDHIAEIERQKPFGFFNDMSRPNWRAFTRELTEVEERMMQVPPRPTGWKGRLLRLSRWFGR
ncbi:hypothetical protein [Sphingomonas sp.]|uniref:hypothetical protein n=1 Tax=Sphingomonas sp. TaxID=28214 RepID=UPI003D6D0FE2